MPPKGAGRTSGERRPSFHSQIIAPTVARPGDGASCGERVATSQEKEGGAATQLRCGAARRFRVMFTFGATPRSAPALMKASIAKDEKGATALHFAATSGHYEMQ